MWQAGGECLSSDISALMLCCFGLLLESGLWLNQQYYTVLYTYVENMSHTDRCHSKKMYQNSFKPLSDWPEPANNWDQFKL